MGVDGYWEARSSKTNCTKIITNSGFKMVSCFARCVEKCKPLLIHAITCMLKQKSEDIAARCKTVNCSHISIEPQGESSAGTSALSLRICLILISNSFHRNLPLDRLKCDILPDQPAAWIYKKSKRPVKLSRISAQVLIDYLKVDRKNLKQLVNRPNPFLSPTPRNMSSSY